ncbi:MAG: helix-turn-helix transcriptional regulator [Bacteroidetes bacterium]|uniref:Helix-turn-helix transcriptional regulator n=1 Tax=Candidatus Merdivivens pullicola TaxID=2840872 RepID=A0A9D9NHD5_9BACT|nr:helix-turn-helix transcriptional regulator [Candidatus Merdivivens pullicola]
MSAKSLTRRESEIAELFAWGASKKEVAERLFISERTVENHARKIYEKTGVSKVNELSAWWFCTKFHISFDLSPLKRKIIATMLLVFMIPQFVDFDNAAIRTRTSTCRTVRVTRSRRKTEDDFATVIM